MIITVAYSTMNCFYNVDTNNTKGQPNLNTKKKHQAKGMIFKVHMKSARH